MIEIKNYEEFARFSRESAIRWCYPDTGNKILWAYVGPWKCECGFESRDERKMWDHLKVCNK